MSQRKHAIVVCCCAWRGPLTARHPCPSCKADHYARLTKPRVTWLRVVAAGGDASRMPRNMRAWFLRVGIMVPGAAAKPGPRSSVAVFRRAELALTDLGAKVHAAASTTSALVTEQTRHDVAASVARHAAMGGNDPESPDGSRGGRR